MIHIDYGKNDTIRHLIVKAEMDIFLDFNERLYVIAAGKNKKIDDASTRMMKSLFKKVFNEFIGTPGRSFWVLEFVHQGCSLPGTLLKSEKSDEDILELQSTAQMRVLNFLDKIIDDGFKWEDQVNSVIRAIVISNKLEFNEAEGYYTFA